MSNIYLYEHTPEAIEEVHSGNAVRSSGGIRRIGEGGGSFIELARPASLSVADFQDLFVGKEHALEIDERLKNFESRIPLSDFGLREIENAAWLNNAAIRSTYNLTANGFQQILQGLEYVAKQLSAYEQYVYERDKKQLAQETQKYINYLKTDAGNLWSRKYNVTNGNIAEHLDQMAAFIKTLMQDIKSDGDSFIAVMILKDLLPPFAYVVRRYSALYYYENDGELMPGAYDEWTSVISMVAKSRKYKEQLTYYINLKFTMPFKDKMLLSNIICVGLRQLIYNVGFDKNYSRRHSRDEYLSIGEQIREKIVMKEYDIDGGVMRIFLGDNRKAYVESK